METDLFKESYAEYVNSQKERTEAENKLEELTNYINEQDTKTVKEALAQGQAIETELGTELNDFFKNLETAITSLRDELTQYDEQLYTRGVDRNANFSGIDTTPDIENLSGSQLETHKIREIAALFQSDINKERENIFEAYQKNTQEGVNSSEEKFEAASRIFEVLENVDYALNSYQETLNKISEQVDGLIENQTKKSDAINQTLKDTVVKVVFEQTHKWADELETIKSCLYPDDLTKALTSLDNICEKVKEQNGFCSLETPETKEDIAVVEQHISIGQLENELAALESKLKKVQLYLEEADLEVRKAIFNENKEGIQKKVASGLYKPNTIDIELSLVFMSQMSSDLEPAKLQAITTTEALISEVEEVKSNDESFDFEATESPIKKIQEAIRKGTYDLEAPEIKEHIDFLKEHLKPSQEKIFLENKLVELEVQLEKLQPYLEEFDALDGMSQLEQIQEKITSGTDTPSAQEIEDHIKLPLQLVTLEPIKAEAIKKIEELVKGLKEVKLCHEDYDFSDVENSIKKIQETITEGVYDLEKPEIKEEINNLENFIEGGQAIKKMNELKSQLLEVKEELQDSDLMDAYKCINAINVTIRQGLFSFEDPQIKQNHNAFKSLIKSAQLKTELSKKINELKAYVDDNSVSLRPPRLAAFCAAQNRVNSLKRPSVEKQINLSKKRKTRSKKV